MDFRSEDAYQAFGTRPQKREVTKEQVRAAVGLVLAVSETIRELGSVPEGILYSALMGKFPTMGLTEFESILGTIERAGGIVRSHHVATWVGPNEEVSR